MNRPTKTCTDLAKTHLTCLFPSQYVFASQIQTTMVGSHLPTVFHVRHQLRGNYGIRRASIKTYPNTLFLQFD
ncbi:hypothetical protein YQ44_14165 [Janthinobacterium sp. 1_2014MBL_MicDiv]|nr:hypothetical protein YQ44_14165 [Janthinobacterium sp. 1_2014MBL_MicDiv]